VFAYLAARYIGGHELDDKFFTPWQDYLIPRHCEYPSSEVQLSFDRSTPCGTQMSLSFRDKFFPRVPIVRVPNGKGSPPNG
jgi:hypothetical protein